MPLLGTHLFSSTVEASIKMQQTRNMWVTAACICFIFGQQSKAFQFAPKSGRARDLMLMATRPSDNRRRFLVHAASSPFIFLPTATRADEDLTSQIYNPDGSLKEGVKSTVANTKLVAFTFDQSDSLQVNVNGDLKEGTTSNSGSQQVHISYELPDKWGKGYIDTSEGVNAPACKRITIYKAPGKASLDSLDKATTIGVGKALRATDSLARLKTADIIGGRKQTKNEQKYYEFDMASAPDKCEGTSKDDLGLGFCPYDSVFLISATILDQSLYVMAIECDNQEWKQGNADLKRVRSSFNVESVV